MAPRYIVAIIGGATAGAETAGMLASRGVLAVVFEQNPRPYGKIEDGLPRWHVKLRKKEYELINEKLDNPNVHFVPLTKIGRDIAFDDIARQWGFTATILALGAWRDRPLPVEGADEYVGRGLVYQNPFIHWFNHFHEHDYAGPHYEIAGGAIVVGGGLASIDVMKVLQIEATRRALAKRGIDEDMLEIEHSGVPAALEKHGLSRESLGLEPATLFYRRRIEDMPLTEIPEGSEPERRKKFEAVRRRILEKAMQKYLFRAQPQRVPIGLITENDRLAGLRFQHTKVVDGRVVPVENAHDDVRSPLVVSSIGSIPEPLPGIPRRGEVYEYTDQKLGRLAGFENVFSTGNVVTGKGNIAASRRHSIEITTHVIEQFLGIGSNGHEGEEELLGPIAADADDTAADVAEWIHTRPALALSQVTEILQRVRQRQNAVGYTGSYRDWIARVTPPDLV